jgi:alkylated DNA repair dioxygenase AlkB
MGASPGLAWQPSLFEASDEPAVDATFSALTRVQLDVDSWVDHAPGWLSGSGRVFEEVLASRGWAQRERHMYDKRVLEPRLTAPWNARSGEALEPPILEEIRRLLSSRYDRAFDSVGFNLYRDGRDSVAWHADRIPKAVRDPVVALLSLGEPRRFLLRPKGGGPSTTLHLGGGDLLVTGGDTQRTWDHSVPKVKEAGPRISLAYRHDMRAAAEYEDDSVGRKRPDDGGRGGT